MSGPPPVSVVVLTWNGRHLLTTCLDALLDQTYPAVEIIVVDNASADGTVAFVRERYGRRVNTLSLSQNRGYARGNNVGLSAAAGDFLVTLNNDTRVRPDWIQKLVDAVSRFEGIGICASRQVRMGNPDVIDSVGIGIHRNGDSYNVGGGDADRGQYTRPMEVFGASGASAFYRRDALREAGLFDEDFFAYEEEFDLCWRIRLMGWRCLYVLDAILEHEGGATVRRRPGLRDYLQARNRIFAIVKNYPAGVLPEAMVDLAKCELWNGFLAVCHGETFRLRARLDAIPLLGKMLRKRRDIQSCRRMADSEFRSWLDVAMRPIEGLE